MTKHVLILDGGCELFGHGGSLNHYLSNIAEEELKALGYTVEKTLIDSEWVPAEEAEKIKRADFVILQTPGWWMSTPWQVKRYEDFVFGQPGVVGTDGRHRATPAKDYGRGGILTDKKYMISMTWNAPKEAFTDPNEFFGGKGIDAVIYPLHKAFEFLGMQTLPTFMCNDVLKNPTIESDVARYKEHLKKVFG